MRRQSLTLSCFAGCTAAAGASADIVSTFDSGAEGWICTDDAEESAEPDHLARGGNPGGYVSKADFGSGSWFFNAPGAFLGDQPHAIGGELRFDLRSLNGSNPSTEDDDVLLEGEEESSFDWIFQQVSSMPTGPRLPSL